jgi:hypothetical protein
MNVRNARCSAIDAVRLCALSRPYKHPWKPRNLAQLIHARRSTRLRFRMVLPHLESDRRSRLPRQSILGEGTGDSDLVRDGFTKPPQWFLANLPRQQMVVDSLLVPRIIVNLFAKFMPSSLCRHTPIPSRVGPISSAWLWSTTESLISLGDVWSSCSSRSLTHAPWLTCAYGGGTAGRVDPHTDSWTLGQSMPFPRSCI